MVYKLRGLPQYGPSNNEGNRDKNSQWLTCMAGTVGAVKIQGSGLSDCGKGTSLIFWGKNDKYNNSHKRTDFPILV